MPTSHTVQPGEHLAGIAEQHGFPDYRALWDHPKNSALKKRRQNPNVLSPGDEVFVPDAVVKTVSAPADQRHRFRLKGRPLKLRLTMKRRFSGPIANAPCRLVAGPDTADLTSSAQGELEHPVAKTAKYGRLTVTDSIAVGAQVARFDVTVPLNLGDLNPVDELSGQLARLTNLGYYLGPRDGADAGAFRSAVEEFQCEHGLVVDGVCGPATQAKLKAAHGC